MEKNLKNKPTEQWTKEDVFDRYVGYGSQQEIETPEVQKLFVKFELFDELINLVNNIITEKEVVDKLLNSNIFENKNLQKIKGKIKEIKILDIENDHMDELKQILIIFEKEDNLEQIQINDFCLTANIKQYLQDKEKYKNSEIIAIVEKEDKKLILKCFCNPIKEE